ncbi:hypothetical protein Tco_1144703 [Tanacetum coccineum]
MNESRSDRQQTTDNNRFRQTTNSRQNIQTTDSDRAANQTANSQADAYKPEQNQTVVEQCKTRPNQASPILGFPSISLVTVGGRSESLVGQGSTYNRVCGRECSSAVSVCPRRCNRCGFEDTHVLLWNIRSMTLVRLSSPAIYCIGPGPIITSLKCVLTQEHLDAICAKYFVPEEVHPQLPSSDALMPEQDQHDTLIAQASPFLRFLEEFLCWVGISRNYLLNKDTYPRFEYEDGEGGFYFPRWIEFFLPHRFDPSQGEDCRQSQESLSASVERKLVGEASIGDGEIGATACRFPSNPKRLRAIMGRFSGFRLHGRSVASSYDVRLLSLATPADGRSGKWFDAEAFVHRGYRSTQNWFWKKPMSQGMEHEQLFTEFNVSAACNLSLSSEVRMLRSTIFQKDEMETLSGGKEYFVETKDKEIKT